MKTVQISLNSIGKVKSFVNAITQFDPVIVVVAYILNQFL